MFLNYYSQFSNIVCSAELVFTYCRGIHLRVVALIVCDSSIVIYIPLYIKKDNDDSDSETEPV